MIGSGLLLTGLFLLFHKKRLAPAKNYCRVVAAVLLLIADILSQLQITK